MKIVFSVLLLGIISPVFSQPTEIVYLSGVDASQTVTWDFYCTDGANSGKWSEIEVPSNWELQGYGTYNYGHDWKDENIKLGKEHGLYKYQFDVPGSWKGKVIQIVFDGAMTDTEVKINGKKAGEIHQGGFNRFKYDISGLLKYGKNNLLEVDVAKHSSDKTVNRAEREADFWIFGGIYRPVYLEIFPKQHLTRVAIDAKADGRFNVLAVLNNKKITGKVQVELFDLDGNPVNGTFQSQIEKGISKVFVTGRFEGIRAWNPEFPNLYDMKVSLWHDGDIVHSESKRIGFRTVELRRHDGFYVNGKKVVFKGVNRHSFWPETGRALSDENHKTDIGLMKEMNMNAVRMSHYCPDKRFLDLCDSLGLFVLDELAGWQQGYDTIIGPKRVRELILKDENHPSVVIWDHGNEGGWDFANERWFHYYDIQKRPVIYPWLHRNGVDTHHYVSYDFAINRYAYGNDVFMPTELLHGLYDGGLGAGLNDLWGRFRSNPRAAGGFLWVFCDEAVLRTDKKGTVFDSDENRAPDGILGPHREKEGSFYTIKELWSPVKVEPVVINPQWDGKLLITNDYIYTNLSACSFTYEAFKAPLPGMGDLEVVNSGSFSGPDAAPGETRTIDLEINDEFRRADLLSLTAFDPYGKEIYTWSWPIQHPKVIVDRYVKKENEGNGNGIITEESGGKLLARASGIEIIFDLKNGRLLQTNNSDGEVSFSGGPVPVGIDTEIKEVNWKMDAANNLIVEARAEGFPSYFSWKFYPSGLLELKVAPILMRVKGIDFIGVSFNYPEKNVKSMRWFGNGPYRVWKNRIHGTNMGIWEKEYNNTITGESFNSLIYPEFKGYHSNVNWVRFETSESPFTILVETPNIFMQIFTPDAPKGGRGGTVPPFPDGDISFLYEIPAIGTKFQQSVVLGPTGQKGMNIHRLGDDNDPIHVWFDFRVKE